MNPSRSTRPRTGLRLVAGLGALALATVASGPRATAQGFDDEAGGLGGFDLQALATPVTVLFDSPSAGIPASPIMEWDLAFTTARLESGPVGHALAAPIWPGETAATVGPFVSSEANRGARDGGAPDSFAFPEIPSWPVKAEASQPGTASDDRSLGPVGTMQAAARETISEAVTTLTGFGLDAVVDARSMRGVSRTFAGTDRATAEAQSVVKDLTIAGGLVTVEQVTSRVEVVSDGKAATVEGRTTVAGLTIGGTPFEFDGEKLTVADSGDDGALADAVDAAAGEALKAAGIEVMLTNADDIVDGPVGDRAASALVFKFTNTPARQIMDGMPEELQRQLGSFVGTDQSVLVILGGIRAKAAASEPFDFPDFPVIDPGTGGGTDFTGTGTSGGGFAGTDVLSAGTGTSAGTSSLPTFPAPSSGPPTAGRTLGGVSLRPALATPVDVNGIPVGAVLAGLVALLAGARMMRRASDTLLGAKAQEEACLD
jgi:hypothetical protein